MLRQISSAALVLLTGCCLNAVAVGTIGADAGSGASGGSSGTAGMGSSGGPSGSSSGGSTGSASGGAMGSSSSGGSTGSSGSTGGACLPGGSNCTGNYGSCCPGLSCVQSPTEHEAACCGGSNPWPACQGLGGSSSGGSSGSSSGAADGGLCPPGELLCGGLCTDPRSDPGNCGGCAGDGGRNCPECDSWGCGVCCEGMCGLLQGDPQNCGGCGIACAPGQYCSLDPFETCEDLPDAGVGDAGQAACSGGLCVVTLAAGQGQPQSLAVGRGQVYWTDSAGGTVLSVPVGGGTPSTLASGQPLPAGIAANGTNVYWTTQNGPSVMSEPLGGGAPVTLDQGADAYGFGIALNATNIYFAFSTSIFSMTLDGGRVGTLAGGSGTIGGIAVGPTSVYWTTGTQVLSAPNSLGHGTATGTTFASGGASWVAADSNNVYWTNPGTAANNYTDGTVMQAALDGGNATTLASGQSNPSTVAVDSKSVYWGNAGTAVGTCTGCGVMAVPIGGGPTTTLAAGETSDIASDIAVDGTSVYWTFAGTAANGYLDGAILKVTPPWP